MFDVFPMKLSAVVFSFSLLFHASAKRPWETQKCPIYEFVNRPESLPMSPTTADMVHKLIANCHYDKLQPPPTIDENPLPVYVKVYFYFLKSYEAHNLQFTVYMLLQCRFVDPRLQFDPEVYNVTEIIGTRELGDLLWKPHVYFNNERQSMVMGPGQNEVMTHIYPDGTVLYTKRVQTTLFCWMKLQKFPFDSQDCSLILDSWSYNMSHMTLHWEDSYPVHCRDHLTLTEFTLVGDPVATTTINGFDFDKDSRSGNFRGNYSSLVVTFHLQRESGFYIYDYFIPSIFLVVVSWVSFWLEADSPMVSSRVALVPELCGGTFRVMATSVCLELFCITNKTPERIMFVMLGCSTMLAFIILAHQTGNSLPKVSYIKASEIWFLGCTAFIFGSLVEFAFVNIIYRSRRKHIGLKKVNSKYILKETLTPKAKRKELDLRRSSSCPYNLDSATDWVTYRKGSTSLGVELNRDIHKRSLPDIHNLPPDEEDDTDMGRKKENLTPTVMTPREVSNWIDTRSRVIFPVSFMIFNIGYWSYVYYL